MDLFIILLRSFSRKGMTGLSLGTSNAPSSSCGNNAYWTFDPAAGKLTISGEGAIDNYGSYPPWSEYGNKITSVEIENGITHIGEHAFSNCTGLTSITIPDSVASIGDYAFRNCFRLASIEIPDSVTSIGLHAFRGCTGITDVYCYAKPASLTWNDDGCEDFMGNAGSRKTVCRVPVKYLDEYNTKYGVGGEYPVNVTFVGDVDMGLGEHLYGHSITLDGSIGVNFFVELTDELLASETAEILFTIPIGSKTYYKFRCSISAKDMASTITAKLIDGEKKGKAYTYSVKEYADNLLAHADDNEEYAKAAPLVESMLNYGAASQKYFGIENTAANASLIDADKILGDVTIPAKFIYNDANTTLPGGVTFEGATLSLKSETTLSLYFIGLPEGTKFTCNGKKVETAQNGEYVVARIRGIKANELENNFTVKFKGGSVTYSAMTYCCNFLNSDTDETALQDVCKALYLYAEAANNYS